MTQTTYSAGAAAGTDMEADSVELAAHHLAARHGASARKLAQERVAQLERAGRWREHATALRVLTAVERMLEERLA